MMIDFYCFENTDKTNGFDSDWGTRQKRYKNKNIIITTSKESMESSVRFGSVVYSLGNRV